MFVDQLTFSMLLRNILIMIDMMPPPTQRLQLALNVSDLEEAIEFYSKMFATKPAKLRPGYANFAIANPPLKLVLFEGDEDGTINHLGVETTDASEVIEAEARLTGEGLNTTGVNDTMCCFATKTETWINGPDKTRWEWYVRTGDSETLENVDVSASDTTPCCPDTAQAENQADAGAQPSPQPAICCD